MSLPRNLRLFKVMCFFSCHFDAHLKDLKKFVKVCLHSSNTVQNSFHFDEIFHRKIQKHFRMAFSVSFLKKIFSGFKSSEQVLKTFSQPEWISKDPNFELDPDSLRLLIIRESLHGHKSVIFDSQRTQRFSAPFQDNIDSYDYVHNDIAYKVIRNPQPGYQDEVKTFAEFMLGTIPLSGQNEALKVHYISQSSVLWSLTFQQTLMTSTKCCSPSNRSSMASSFGSRIGGSAQDFFLEGDSGFFSPKPSMISLSFNDTSSDLSLKRRWQQLTTTSMASLSGRSESLLQIPTQESRSRKVKISVGLLITLPHKLEKLNESNVFLEELLQRLKIGVASHLCIKGGSKYAFVHQMYLLYCQTKEIIVTYMSTRRLHLTGWHLKNQHMEYLSHHLIDLKKVLDTKEKKFFLCTWLTAFLTYNPMWAFSMVPEPEMSTKKDNESEEISIRQMMQMSGKSFFYNVGETQKNDLCGGANQIAKFLLTSSDRYSQCLESLIFVTSYFLRSSVIRRRKISACPKITDDLLKPKKVVVRKRNKSEESDGVLFMLGENEKLVQQQKSSSSSKKRESRGSLHYMKINLPSIPTLNSVANDVCPLPYGISISNKVLPGEVLQGCILK